TIVHAWAIYITGAARVYMLFLDTAQSALLPLTNLADVSRFERAAEFRFYNHMYKPQQSCKSGSLRCVLIDNILMIIKEDNESVGCDSVPHCLDSSLNSGNGSARTGQRYYF